MSALSRRRAGPAHQLWAILAIAQRDLTKLLRDRTRLLVSLAFPILLIVGLGVALQPTVGRAVGLDWVTFTFVGVFAATLYQSAAAGMLSVVEDRETDFSRELFVSPVSRLTIVAGKVLGESLVALCQGLGIILFALLLQVQITPGQAAALVPAAVACCLLGAAFGLATLAVLPNQRTGLQVFPFLILPQYFLAGVVAPLHGLPWYLEALSRVMPLRYAVDLTRSAFYAGTPGYRLAVADGPLVDLAVVAGLFAVLLAVGALVFDYRERSR